MKPRTYTYDPATGLLTNKVYADGLGPCYEYDSAGRLAKRVWARGVETDYGYDAIGQLVSIVYSNSFNNLNQNSETHFAGALAALGTYSSPLAATVTVNNVQAQLHDDTRGQANKLFWPTTPQKLKQPIW